MLLIMMTSHTVPDITGQRKDTKGRSVTRSLARFTYEEASEEHGCAKDGHPHALLGAVPD